MYELSYFRNNLDAIAARLAGRVVITIEGLALPGRLDPVQDAFDRCGALQCGFCAPGMIMTALALLRQNPRPTGHEIKEAIKASAGLSEAFGRMAEASAQVMTWRDCRVSRRKATG